MIINSDRGANNRAKKKRLSVKSKRKSKPDQINQKKENITRLSLLDLINLFYAEHDAFFKYVFAIRIFARFFIQAFFELRLPNTLKLLDPDKIEIYSGSLKDSILHEYFADLVYCIPFRYNNDVLKLRLILEHKSYKDRMVVFQTAEYAMSSMKKEYKESQRVATEERSSERFYFSPTVGIIVNQAEKEYPGPFRLRELYHNIYVPDELDTPETSQELEILQDACLDVKPIILDLMNMEPSKLPSSKEHPEIWYILRIMQLIRTKEIKQIAQDTFVGLKPYAKDFYYQDLVAAVFAYIITQTDQVSVEETSSICDEYKNFNQTGEKEMISIIDRIKMGIEEECKERYEKLGEERGEKRGEKRGKKDGKCEAIISILEARFCSVPKKIQSKIKKQMDLSFIEELLKKAAICESLNDFSEEL